MAVKLEGRYGRASQVEPMIIHADVGRGMVRMGDWFAELVAEDRAKAGRPASKPEVWHLTTDRAFCASQVAEWQVASLTPSITIEG
jgi:hypothetical protein